MSKDNASLDSSLMALRVALRLSKTELGARLGVSRKTIARWENDGEMPPIGQRKHVATSFPDAPPHLHAALVRALGLDPSFAASLAPSSPAPSNAASVVDGAFLALCERADASPVRMRAALLDFLRRAEEGGLSLASTRALLEPKTVTPAARGRQR